VERVAEEEQNRPEEERSVPEQQVVEVLWQESLADLAEVPVKFQKERTDREKLTVEDRCYCQFGACHQTLNPSEKVEVTKPVWDFQNPLIQTNLKLNLD
jgi:hypothetical protein